MIVTNLNKIYYNFLQNLNGQSAFRMGTSYKPIPPITTLPFNGFPQPVTAISFDPVSDVLWTGLNSGTVTGYCGTQSIRGPSFRVGGSLGVKKIAAGDHYIRALGDSSNGLGSWTKGGVNKWFHRCAPFFLFLSFKKRYHW